MISARKLAIAVAVVAAATAIGGCGERQQGIAYHQGKYQGKPDTRPWESDPGASLYTTSKWKAGDKTGWETAIKSRNQSQNEYTRAE